MAHRELARLGRWLGVVLAGVLLLGAIAACQPISAPPPGVTRLTLWHGVNPPPNRDVLQGLVDRFNAEHPDIQVEPLYIGQGDQQMPKILAAVVGNASPDMLWYPASLTGQLVDLGALRSLDEWLETSPLGDQIDPALFESMRFNGQTWSIPFATNNLGLFYRPSLLEAAGISPPLKTWEELRQAARQLTRDLDGDGRVDQHGILLSLGKSEWVVFTWLPFMWSAGGEFAPNLAAPTVGPQDVNLLNPGVIAGLQLWQNLVEDGSAVLSQPERGYELDSFLAGKVAMQLTGPWTLGQLQDLDVDYAVMPIPQAQQPATAVGGENLFFFKTTPERERAAWTFAEYVLSEAFQTEWALGTGYLPVNLRSRQSDAYQAFVADQPALKVFLEQSQFGRSRPLFPGYSRISENLGRAIEATVLRQSSAEAALQTAQQRIDLIFGRAQTASPAAAESDRGA